MKELWENKPAEEIKQFFASGVNVNDRNSFNETPLMKAAVYCSPKMMQILIDNGAEVNARDNDGNTPLTFALKYNSNPEVGRLLLANGAML